jgi:outer membrane protein assembly factor BamB
VTLASCSGLIVSYDRASGERLWQYDVRQDGGARSFHGEMVRWDGSLFVASDPTGGHIYRIDALTGHVVWKWRTEKGVTSDLLARDDRIVAVTVDNRLTELDPRTGELLWQSDAVQAQRFAPVTPTPVFLGDALVFGRADGRVSYHAMPQSAPLWETWLAAGVTTDLLVVDDAVVLGTADGTVYRIGPEGQILREVKLDTMPTYRWMLAGGPVLVGMTGVTGPLRELVALDPVTLDALWSEATADPEGWTTAQPALGWGLVLVGNAEPALYAFEPMTGELRWRADTDHPPRTLTVDGDELFVGTFDGTLNVYRRPSTPTSGD